MNNYMDYFTNYIFNNYDMNNGLISLKYYHSLRVAKLMEVLASKLDLTDKDQLLAFKLGLCHDLGRFYEVTRMGKFKDTVFDHGSHSNKILYNDSFIDYMDVDEHLLFRKAIYNHNKKDVTNDLNKRENLFVNLLRDADKIDILWLRSFGKPLEFSKAAHPRILNNYLDNKSLDLKDIKSSTDSTILYLSFFKDLYHKVSHDLVDDYDYFKLFLDNVIVDDNKKELFNCLVNKVNEERGKVYVR